MLTFIGENSLKDYNVLGKAGSDAPLPDSVDTTDQLDRFVEFFVRQGWNVWPLPPDVKEAWERPLEINRRMLIGERALKMRWHMTILGEIVDHFPSKIQKIGVVQFSKQQKALGGFKLKSSILVDDLLRFMADRDYIKMAGRA